MKIARNVVLVVLLSLPSWAGQSIVLTTGAVGNTSIPAQAPNAPCRVESSIHDWAPNPDSGHIVDASACGFDIVFVNVGAGNLLLQFTDTRSVGGGTCQIGIGAVSFITYRFQRIPSGAGGRDTCEAWSINGAPIAVGGQFPNSSKSYSYTSTAGWNSNGACVEGTGWGWGCTGATTGLSIAYYRMYTTTVAVNSAPPTTAQSLAGCLVSWKFDLGNNTPSLNDSCAAGPYNASLQAGSASYVPTPGQNLVVAIAKSGNIPVQNQGWATWVSARLNALNSLDGTASYSQADASPTVTYLWTFTGGPMAPAIDNPTSGTPAYTPTLFGTYNFSLTATDEASNSGSTSLAVGAVAYDDNGVVIPDNPLITQIFGPMIAFGQNPWGFADERALSAVKLQSAFYQAGWGLPGATWLTNGQGTISYTFGGIGFSIGVPGTTLTSGITGASTSISIADASRIPGLAHLPDWIQIGASRGSSAYAGSLELVRICGTTATSGPATLTVCYAGRGISAWGTGQGGSKYLAAQAWPADSTVGEARVSGTSTLFVSDPNTPICPAGAPGPPGPVVYTTGTVSLTGGGNVVTGNGTSWSDTNGVHGTDSIRISATHGGGTPFTFWSIITAIPDVTHMILDVALPPDVDPGPFSYQIVSYRNLALDFQAPDPVDGPTTFHAIQGAAGCESETALFFSPVHDVSTIDTTTFSALHYSYDDALGFESAFGPNFYGSGLAALAFYLRSGWEFANTTHKTIDDIWVKSPELGGGWLGGIPLLQGGGVIGAIASLVLDPTTALHWTDVRAFIGAGEIGAWDCNSDDARDTGYLEARLALGSLFDPDATQRAAWLAALGSGPGTVLAREKNCKGADNSWSNGFLFNGAVGPLTVTNGSTSVSGSGIPGGACYGIASGNVTVTNGSALFTGDGLVDGSTINISGAASGQSLPIRFEFTQTNGKSGQLSGLWPGGSGTFPYTIENSPYMTTIATGTADPMLKENFACTWVNPGRIALSRAWDGPSGSADYLFQLNLAGYGQQPYMLGIKTQALNWGSYVADPATAAGFGTLASLAARWIHDVGYDRQTQGMNYGRLYQACEPEITAVGAGVFDARQPGCNQSMAPASVDSARTLTAETGAALGLYFGAQSYSPDAQTWGDTAYGSIWGYCPYTAPGFYCDSNYVRYENSDASLAAYKWPGFFFGMGMAHQWPAARLLRGSPAPDTQSTVNGLVSGTVR